jgi:uridylate kinase
MANQQQPAYKRIVLKISGEALGTPGQTGLDGGAIERLAESIAHAAGTGVEIAIVVGGGNLMRGNMLAQTTPVHEATGHYMGMLATIINGLALQDTIEAKGIPTRVMSAINISQVCEPYIRRRCIRHLEKKRVVVLVSGTGNPFVTTDTCAALRALEIGADILLKATKVDGVYTEDPKKNPAARRYDSITYDQALDQRLGVMDISAFDLCRQKKIPIMVFNVFAPGNLLRAVRGEAVGTLIHYGDQVTP